MDGKVGPLARTVHREQPRDPGRKAGCLVVRKGPGPRRRSWLRRTATPAARAPGPRRRGADRHCRRSSWRRQRPRAPRPTQQPSVFLEPDDVGRHVPCRIGDGRPHPGSCREVEDHRRLDFADRGEHRGRVSRVDLMQREGPRSEGAVQVPQLGLTTVRGCVERIDGGDLPAIGQQAVDERAADEAAPPVTSADSRGVSPSTAAPFVPSHNALMTGPRPGPMSSSQQRAVPGDPAGAGCGGQRPPPPPLPPAAQQASVQPGSHVRSPRRAPRGSLPGPPVGRMVAQGCSARIIPSRPLPGPTKE